MAQTSDVDIVIIGAGAAGLTAARTAMKHGLSFTLIEARERIGGRTVTDTSFGAPVDGGATFIHFADKNPWTAIAAELGIATQYGNWRRGGQRAYVDGVQEPEEFEMARRQGRNQMWELAADIDFDNDLSFAALVSRAPKPVQDAAYSMSRGAVGEEPERVSVADYIRLYEGYNLVVPEGYGTLVTRFGAGVPVRLGVRATAIDWSGQGVKVTTGAGDIRAKAAVVTVPIGVLKAESIRFTPALPRPVLSALDGLGMGALSKMILKFEGTRLDASPDMHLVEVAGAQPGMSFEMWPFDKDVVVAWYGADYARRINDLPEQEAIRHMLERLVRIVGRDAEKAFRGGKRFGWSADPFSAGSYSYVKPGHGRARDALRQPVGDRLWFAGEAMAGKASMTVGGAHQTGDHAVEAIAARLKAGR